MAVSSITGAYGAYGIDLSLYKAQEQSEGSGKSSTSTTASRYATQSSDDTSVTGFSLDFLAQISSVLKEISPSSDGKMTFGKVEQYRKQLEETFSAKVREDLTKLGVDKDVQFRLVTDDSTGVKVITDSADKAKIEKYFKDNPSMVKDFQKIQAMSNLDKARKASGTSMHDLRTRLQMEAMSAWWNEDGAASQIMDYTGDQASFMAGLRYKV